MSVRGVDREFAAPDRAARGIGRRRALPAVLIERLIYRQLRVRRVPPINVVISTLGVSILLTNGARLLWGSEPIAYKPLFPSQPIKLGTVALAPQSLGIVGLSLAIMTALMLFFRYSRTGIAMQAAAQDPDAARLMGVSIARTTTQTLR